jgi:hypothetical protein
MVALPLFIVSILRLIQGKDTILQTKALSSRTLLNEVTSAASCMVQHVDWIGDGWCDEEYNTYECNYDMGDCCQSTCNYSVCGVLGYRCENSNAEENKQTHKKPSQGSKQGDTGQVTGNNGNQGGTGTGGGNSNQGDSSGGGSNGNQGDTGTGGGNSNQGGSSGGGSNGNQGNQGDSSGGSNDNQGDSSGGGSNDNQGDSSGGSNGNQGDSSGGGGNSNQGDSSGGNEGDSSGGSNGNKGDSSGGSNGNQGDSSGGSNGNQGDSSGGGGNGNQGDSSGGNEGDSSGGSNGNEGDSSGGVSNDNQGYTPLPSLRPTIVPTLTPTSSPSIIPTSDTGGITDDQSNVKGIFATSAPSRFVNSAFNFTFYLMNTTMNCFDKSDSWVTYNEEVIRCALEDCCSISSITNVTFFPVNPVRNSTAYVSSKISNYKNRSRKLLGALQATMIATTVIVSTLPLQIAKEKASLISSIKSGKLEKRIRFVSRQSFGLALDYAVVCFSDSVQTCLNQAIASYSSLDQCSMTTSNWDHLYARECKLKIILSAFVRIL